MHAQNTIFILEFQTRIIRWQPMIWFLLVSKIISMKANYCTKSVFIRIHSGPHFPAFGLNTDQNNSKNRHFLRSEQYTGKKFFFDSFASKFNTLKPTRPEKKSN